VTGTVELRDGSHVVVVHDPAAIVLGSDLGGGPVGDGSGVTHDPNLTSSPDDARAAQRQAGFGDAGLGLPGAGAGLATLLAVAGTSIAATVLRRRHAQRLLASRVAVRLAAVARPSERGPSVGPTP
jgi:hypothetical protein